MSYNCGMQVGALAKNFYINVFHPEHTSTIPKPVRVALCAIAAIISVGGTAALAVCISPLSAGLFTAGVAIALLALVILSRHYFVEPPPRYFSDAAPYAAEESPQPQGAEIAVQISSSQPRVQVLPPKGFWEDLPDEVLLKIFAFLGDRTLAIANQVSRQWRVWATEMRTQIWRDPLLGWEKTHPAFRCATLEEHRGKMIRLLTIPFFQNHGYRDCPKKGSLREVLLGWGQHVRPEDMPALADTVEAYPEATPSLYRAFCAMRNIPRSSDGSLIQRAMWSSAHSHYQSPYFWLLHLEMFENFGVFGLYFVLLNRGIEIEIKLPELLALLEGVEAILEEAPTLLGERRGGSFGAKQFMPVFEAFNSLVQDSISVCNLYNLRIEICLMKWNSKQRGRLLKRVSSFVEGLGSPQETDEDPPFDIHAFRNMVLADVLELARRKFEIEAKLPTFERMKRVCELIRLNCPEELRATLTG